MRTSIFGLGWRSCWPAPRSGRRGLIVGADWRSARPAGLILAMSSTAIVLQNLEEKGLRQGPVGQAAFGCCCSRTWR
jgi:glutathione-regulated potassium-efflux system ancillary protein KefC/glutathione-regulated potassium-efflux system protein KefB